MKRRILMVSAMILLLGSQVQMHAQRHNGPDHKRPGMEIHDNRRPSGPMNHKFIGENDILRIQDFYKRKYNIRLSRKEAERILLADMKDKRHRPDPRGPQRPPRK